MKIRYNYFVRFKFVILLSFSLTTCVPEESAPSTPNVKEDNISLGKEEVLFIGNSHTYFNQGIASHLGKFRAMDGLEFKPLLREAARGGFSLQDHLEDQTTLELIDERSWDIIVLQENTLIASETLDESIDAMVSISEMVKQKGTSVYLFMTWPYKDQSDMLSGIKETYENGMLQTGATLVPVGLEWQAINQNGEVEVNLYDADGIHPSLEGTFYATAMFYRTIYNKSPSENAYLGGLNLETANFLKSKAD